MRKLLILCFLVLLSSFSCREELRFSPSGTVLLGFYNMDNLYDTEDDPLSNDEDFTPNGRYAWTLDRYESKLKALAKVISGLSDGQSPDILGMCEVENMRVLIDLINTMHAQKSYAAVHYDSKDERGSDVALIYNKNKLKLLGSKQHALQFKSDSNDRTRDILWVKLQLLESGDTLQLAVCHFPSRRGGVAQSEEKRLEAAALLRRLIAKHCRLSSDKLIVCGDFNDEPGNKSLASVLGAADPEIESDSELFNLMWDLKKQGSGTYRYKGQWNMLDQFIISRALWNTGGNAFCYKRGSVKIKNETWMQQTGKYKGYPLRTFGGTDWLNGYSDHFPISIELQAIPHGKN